MRRTLATAAEVVNQHEQLSERHRFRLESDGARPIGVWDRNRLARVLENLVDNAVKFSPNGGEIIVRVGADGARAFAAVADRGIGIASSELDLIFSPMYRGRNARGTVGTGLGLAGSRQLIEQMGGSVTVDSELGVGSTFTVWLPRARA
ncbi:MAG TPA: ATP-binding protein [Candidatus Limnocylindrales bacterium]|nr:ATP-binding protein [Candidatus Limnocylindrales bacterium]